MKTEIFLPSSDGKRKIHVIEWKPEGEATLTVQLVHGMCEYIDRYDEFAQFLVKQGYYVIGHDHIGHGDSIKENNDLGFFAEEKGSDPLIKDIYKVTQYAKSQNSKIPFYIMGHSMGSFLTRKYLCQYGEEIDGAIIMGTGFQAGIKTFGGKSLVTILSWIKGWNYRSNFVNKIALGKQPNEEWISRDSLRVKAYNEDEKCGFVFTLNGFYGLFDAVNYACKKKNIKQMPKDLPVLFISGEKDPVGDCGKGVIAAAETFKSVGMNRVDTILYSGALHEVLNETNRDEVMQDISSWIKKTRKLQ